jgi:PAS domain S-box-containing protein
VTRFGAVRGLSSGDPGVAQAGRGVVSLSEPTTVDVTALELAGRLRRYRLALLDQRHDRSAGGLVGDASGTLLPGASELLDGLADALSGDQADRTPASAIAERHAMRRLREGAALRHLIGELAGLRNSIIDAWRHDSGADPEGPQLRLLNRMFDSMTAAAGESYFAARDRTLRALDRISRVAFESRKVDDLLQGLLHVILEAASAVDTASILLLEGDWLVARAAAGLEEAMPGGGFRVRIGEGVAGRIAAEGRPRLLSAEQIAAEAVSPFLKAKGLRSLYGVPLQTDGRLVGVAHIGSLSVASFSEQDRGVFRDMCARATTAIHWQLLQGAAEARVRELETVLESIPEALLVADSHGVHHANRAALELLGVDSVEQLSRPATSLAELIEARRADTGDLLADGERFLPAALRGEATTQEIVVRHQRTGQDVVLRCSAAPVRAGQQIIGAVAACADVTGRKREEEDRDRLYRHANQAVADRQHVLGVVSHDLRNPLNTIVLAATTLKEDDLPAELRHKAVGAITRATARMNRMISDLLDVNSIEAGRLRLTPLPLDPRSVVEEVVELFGPQAAARGLALITAMPESVPLVRGDRHRLVQALSNLVSNALKVTREGSVTIRLEPGDREAVFSVVDTGPGIPEAGRERIFDPYWRAEGATYKGTGLGLAIVRGIVEAHGGRISIESVAGQGAAVLLSVPMA